MTDIDFSPDADLLPPETHPNYRLWANYARFSHSRGQLVTKLIALHQPVTGLEVLDLGCGAGGTTLALAKAGARVTAVDANPGKVRRLRQAVPPNHKIVVKQEDALDLDFQHGSFDWIILQDVLEHLPQPGIVLNKLEQLLRPTGKIYISTPNRWSPLNFISDPHWNLPFVACLPRPAVEFFITRLVRRERSIRSDFGVLLSLRQIQKLFAKHFSLRMLNSAVALELFQRPKMVVNSDFHIKLVQRLKYFRLDKILTRLVNDRFGFFNTLINPTWYFVASKIGDNR